MRQLSPLMIGIFIGICMIGGMAVLIFTQAGEMAGRVAAEASALESGIPAPDFELYTLTGRTVQLSELRGLPVVLGFGTSYCEGCDELANLLQNMQDNNPQIQVILVNVREEEMAVVEYADLLSLTYPIALDLRGAAAGRFQVDTPLAFPALFLIDEQGSIRANFVGEVDEFQVYQALDQMGVIQGDQP